MQKFSEPVNKLITLHKITEADIRVLPDVLRNKVGQLVVCNVVLRHISNCSAIHDKIKVINL